MHWSDAAPAATGDGKTTRMLLFKSIPESITIKEEQEYFAFDGKNYFTIRNAQDIIRLPNEHPSEVKVTIKKRDSDTITFRKYMIYTGKRIPPPRNSPRIDPHDAALSYEPAVLQGGKKYAAFNSIIEAARKKVEKQRAALENVIAMIATNSSQIKYKNYKNLLDLIDELAGVQLASVRALTW